MTTYTRICRICEGTMDEVGKGRRRYITALCVTCRKELSREFAPNGIGYIKRGHGPKFWKLPSRFGSVAFKN